MLSILGVLGWAREGGGVLVLLTLVVSLIVCVRACVCLLPVGDAGRGYSPRLCCCDAEAVSPKSQYQRYNKLRPSVETSNQGISFCLSSTRVSNRPYQRTNVVLFWVRPAVVARRFYSC